MRSYLTLTNSQSYLWNHAASDRVARFGLGGAVEGDLVYEDYENDNDDGSAMVLDDAGDAAAAMADDGADSDAEGGSGSEAGGAGGAPPARRVRHVTAAEAAAGTIPITAVLLPLPAASSVYPAHASADVYSRLAAADGVALVGGQHSVREFSLAAFTGGYRRLLHRPAALAWRLLRYEDAGADLTATELAVALQREGRRQPQPAARPQPDAEEQQELRVEGEGRFLALQLTFQLPPSCYATMVRCDAMRCDLVALTPHLARYLTHAADAGATAAQLIRELLKAPTSAAFHKGIGGHEEADGAAAAAEGAAAAPAAAAEAAAHA